MPKQISVECFQKGDCCKIRFGIQSYNNIDNRTKKKLFMLNHTMNKAMKLEFIVFINKFYPQVNSNIIFTNNHSVQNFFKFMDIIPEVVKSKVVYTYCTQCSESYVGETTRHFHNLVSKHRGLSPRAGVPIRAVPKSNVCNIF